MSITNNSLDKLEQLVLSDEFLRYLFTSTDNIELVTYVTQILLNNIQKMRKELE